jgi:hypothetical protein
MPREFPTSSEEMAAAEINPEGTPPDIKIEADRLSEGEAHDEANMMQAQLPDSHDRYGYDYEQAQALISELKKELKNEPNFIKDMYKVGRVLHNAAKVVGAPAWMVLMLLESGPSGEGPTTFADVLEDLNDAITERLAADPAKKMKEAERRGRRFGKLEIKKANQTEEADKAQRRQADYEKRVADERAEADKRYLKEHNMI